MERCVDGTMWRGVPASLAIVGLITIVGFWIETIIRGSNFAILYMLAVIFSALRWGRMGSHPQCGLWSAIVYVLLCPSVPEFCRHRHLVFDHADRALDGRIDYQHADGCSQRRRPVGPAARSVHCGALSSFTTSLASGNKLDQVLDAVARHFVEIFRRPIVVLLPDADRLTVRFRSAEMVFNECENEIASWVFQNGQEAGCGTATFSDSLIRYRPLKTAQGIVGVIGFQTKSSKELLSPISANYLGIFMNQTALAITRADLAKKAQRAEVLQEADKLQKALLNSVSHNLRTPLASVLGVLNTILEDGVAARRAHTTEPLENCAGEKQED